MSVNQGRQNEKVKPAMQETEVYYLQTQRDYGYGQEADRKQEVQPVCVGVETLGKYDFIKVPGIVA